MSENVKANVWRRKRTMKRGAKKRTTKRKLREGGKIDHEG